MGPSELSARISVLERNLLSLKVPTDEHVSWGHHIDRKMENLQNHFARLVTHVKNQEESLDLMLEIVKMNFKHITMSMEGAHHTSTPHRPPQ